MGFPHSKEINVALQTFETVIQKMKYISICLAFFHILLVVFLALILAALLGLLITVNPDLEHERRILVTPTMKRMVKWIMEPWIMEPGDWDDHTEQARKRHVL